MCARVEFVLFWVAFAIVVGVVAGSRGRSGLGWFLFSLVLTPLLGLILVALLPAVTQGPTPDTHVKCPDCAELVLREARVCKHCGCRLAPQLEPKDDTVYEAAKDLGRKLNFRK